MDSNFDYVAKIEGDFINGMDSLGIPFSGTAASSRLAALEDELALSIGAAAGFWLESDSDKLGGTYSAHDPQSGFKCTLRVDYSGNGSVAYFAQVVAPRPFSRRDIEQLVQGTNVHSPNLITTGLFNPDKTNSVVFSTYQDSAAELSSVLAAVHSRVLTPIALGYRN